jgi:hypothetical protein
MGDRIDILKLFDLETDLHNGSVITAGLQASGF